jgi:hypothetical protein
MSGHTAGPWRYRPYYRGGFQVTDASGTPIPVAGEISVADDVKEANSRLIAAAPELLAACEDVLSDPDCDLYSSAIARVRAAVAKATGAAS